ncbi:hypothetical protein L3556_00415 [Candidatus Synechococcus calcipolaris G9]|uniref:Roadblock/LAMTOR2 domain-containing protein n=1 Tax=Candidatus Synechococcus calcipolaris G9 TaxID=1497997 RepID=A0ABT6EU24_9SYNE|nr:hypothetical protein [Candidatus Synechococcus calcipolaris]MDG2989400.1 hypothetical protein [Candidatus Synechococcus calcipolaris G9]
MSNIQTLLEDAIKLDGALAVAIGDWKTGMCLGSLGTNTDKFPAEAIELAVAGNTEVIRAKMKVASSLGLDEKIEDILVTLEGQYHLMELTQTISGLFFYLVLDREKGNLALARIKLKNLERQLAL